MHDPRQGDAAVDHQLVSVFSDHLLEQSTGPLLVPGGAKQHAAVGERLVHILVAIDDRVAYERDVRRDAHLHQEHEQVAELRNRRLRAGGHPRAKLCCRMGHRPSRIMMKTRSRAHSWSLMMNGTGSSIPYRT